MMKSRHCPQPDYALFRAAHFPVILRSRALARRLEGWPRALVADPSRLAEDGERLRMTAVLMFPLKKDVDARHKAGHDGCWMAGTSPGHDEENRCPPTGHCIPGSNRTP